MFHTPIKEVTQTQGHNNLKKSTPIMRCGNNFEMTLKTPNTMKPQIPQITQILGVKSALGGL